MAKTIENHEASTETNNVYTDAIEIKNKNEAANRINETGQKIIKQQEQKNQELGEVADFQAEKAAEIKSFLNTYGKNKTMSKFIKEYTITGSADATEFKGKGEGEAKLKEKFNQLVNGLKQKGLGNEISGISLSPLDNIPEDKLNDYLAKARALSVLNSFTRDEILLIKDKLTIKTDIATKEGGDHRKSAFSISAIEREKARATPPPSTIVIRILGKVPVKDGSSTGRDGLRVIRPGQKKAMINGDNKLTMDPGPHKIENNRDASSSNVNFNYKNSWKEENEYRNKKVGPKYAVNITQEFIEKNAEVFKKYFDITYEKKTKGYGENKTEVNTIKTVQYKDQGEDPYADYMKTMEILQTFQELNEQKSESFKNLIANVNEQNKNIANFYAALEKTKVS